MTTTETIHTYGTHNGVLTVKSLKTGDHRTFRVKTQPEDADFAPGERVVQMLVGPDNTTNYKSFGFVKTNDDGSWGIAVWKSCKGGDFEKMARMLERIPDHVMAGRVEVLFAIRCRRCSRPLTTPKSINSGIGPDCAQKEGWS